MQKDELIRNLNIKQTTYDFSLLESSFTRKEKLSIICHKKDEIGREHGVFYTNANHLLRGDGCPKCQGKYMDKDLFVALANKIHDGIYDYGKFVFVDKSTKGIIHCQRHNIDFEQTPRKHLAGQGCPLCRYEKSSRAKTTDFAKFVEKANLIHNHKYEYDEQTYVNLKTRVRIVCPEHGEFWQTPNNHINKHHSQGCPTCGRIQSAQSRIMTFDEFVTRANYIHNSKYQYIKETYTTASDFVDCICPIHGVFKQKGVNHIDSVQGCPKCSNQMSVAEEDIISYLESVLPGITIERRNRVIIRPYELDIYIPSFKIAIEYDGLIWHSSKFGKTKHHLLDKTKMCEKSGVRLIHIFEDEWQYKKDVVKSRLSTIFGVNTQKIYARQCTIKEVSSKISREFLDNNHLQGFAKAKYHYGLYYQEQLVSLMTFGCMRQMKKNDNDFSSKYELIRFCSKCGINVVGGASRLLRHFIKNVSPKEIISYADKRWSDGNLYSKIGFTHTHDSAPNYFYIIGKKRENRFNYRKGQLVKQGFDETKSEKEIMEERGIPRIYDCGTMVFKLKIKTNTK